MRRTPSRKARPGRGREGARAWYLLIHQLPPEPLYLRAKIRQRLARVGAVALKNAVYVLPRLQDCLEDFEWLAQEAIAGGGEAHVCEAAFLEKETDAALVERFRQERDADYAALAASLQSRKAGRRGGANLPEEDLPARLGRSRKRLEEIARIDFFGAKGRETVERLVEAVERRVEPRPDSSGRGILRGKALTNRTWVTRKGIQVDRIASAWLIRRFVDVRARFRFIDPKRETARPGEIAFDMVGGDFTHEADRCTFETLRRRAAVKDPAIAPIAQIVHEIDLKDGKFGRPETRGIERILSGIFHACSRDEDRLDRGFALFDELYESFRRKPDRGGPTVNRYRIAPSLLLVLGAPRRAQGAGWEPWTRSSDRPARTCPATFAATAGPGRTCTSRSEASSSSPRSRSAPGRAFKKTATGDEAVAMGDLVSPRH